MFGQAPTPNDPVASYEVTTDHLYRNQKPGLRGYAGRPDTLTTAMAGVNNDLVFTTRNVRPTPGIVQVQLAVLGPKAPLWLYEGGRPATLALAPTQGYQLATTFPGRRGNRISLTIIDPGGTTSPLRVVALPPGQITVYLARTANAISTTAAQLVTAINSAPEVNRWVMAWISDAAGAGLVTALPQTFFRGGEDVPYLAYVSLATDVTSVITSTALQVRTLMGGSELMTAALAGTDTGATAVTLLGPAALTGGTGSRGEVGEQEQEDAEWTRLGGKLGQGSGHQLTNYGLQIHHGRSGAARTWKSVPTQDRQITQSSTINHQMEHKPRSDFL